MSGRIKSFMTALAVFTPVAGISHFAAAQPVDYVRVCDAFGADYLYVPGTETCLNPLTGETRTDTADGTVVGESEIAHRIGALEDLYEKAIAGAAVSSALAGPDLNGGDRFGIAVNWGQFEGSNAIGFSAAGVLADDLFGSTRLGIAGGVAFGEHGTIGSRASLQLSW